MSIGWIIGYETKTDDENNHSLSFFIKSNIFVYWLQKDVKINYIRIFIAF